ncbi:hypothetical protein LA080_004789 [Diaporthe eres]|nr:hypothetical protein LA080_004789 [Diaporthe eres]
MSSSLPNTDIPMPTFLGVGCTVASLAGLAVLVRVVANWRLPLRKHLDDFVSVIALAFLAATVALYHQTLVSTLFKNQSAVIEPYVSEELTLYLELADPNVSYDYLIQLSRETVWVGSVAMWISKVPVLLLFITLFGIKRWVKISSQAIIGLTAVVFLAMAAYVTNECSPQGEVDMAFIQECSLASSRAGLILGITSVVTDGITFFLPIPVIVGLALPFHKKIGVCLVFATGSLAIIASAISTSYKWSSFKGSSSGATGSMICTIVECAIAITDQVFLLTEVPEYSGFGLSLEKVGLGTFVPGPRER